MAHGQHAQNWVNEGTDPGGLSWLMKKGLQTGTAECKVLHPQSDDDRNGR